MSQIALKGRHIKVLDIVRALAILQVVLYHYYMEWFQGGFLIVPEGVAANIPRLEVFKDGGILGLIKNIFSFFFVYGFSAVNIFLVLSGFVLTYSLLKKGDRLGGEKKTVRAWASFFRERIRRILIPFYISVILGIGFLFLRNVLFPAMASAPMYTIWDTLKLLFVPFIFYDIQFVQLFNGDYWYVPLILQMYLIFPLMYLLIKKIKPIKFLVLIFTVVVIYRFIAAYYLDSVPMGVIYPAENSYRLFSFFLPRLFEFSLGMAAAYFYFYKESPWKSVSNAICILTGSLLAFSGFVFSSYKWGWALSDPVAGSGLIILFLGIAGILVKNRFMEKGLMIIGGSAYETFLLHHYFLNYLLMPLIFTQELKQEWMFWLAMPVYTGLSILIGISGKALSDGSVAIISKSTSPV
jgi:peptidoglycan/LPS O-acetylase OafA/YrhL